jgi:hypothetical protein
MAYLPDYARGNPLFSGPPAVVGADLFGPLYVGRAPMIADIASPASIYSGEAYDVTEYEAEDPLYRYVDSEETDIPSEFLNVATGLPFYNEVLASVEEGTVNQLTKQDLVDAISMRVVDDEAQLTRQTASIYGGIEGRREAMNAQFTQIKEVMNTFTKAKLADMFRYLEDPGLERVELSDEEKNRLRSLRTIALRRPFRL